MNAKTKSYSDNYLRLSLDSVYVCLLRWPQLPWLPFWGLGKRAACYATADGQNKKLVVLPPPIRKV